MSTTTIRVSAETRDRLNRLARRRGEAAGEVVAALVAEADDRALLADASAAWERITKDADELARYRAETAELPAFDAEPPPY